MKIDICRICGKVLTHSFANLGMTPLANSFLSARDLEGMEQFYPLHAYVCSECFLVQLQDVEKPENIFSDYAYFSSYSALWLKHAQIYAEMITTRFSLNEQSQVVEIASNDGYLLHYFKNKKIPALGIEPAENVANIAISNGIETKTLFFSYETALQLINEGIHPDLIIANNVLAHVPQLSNFIKGMKILLKTQGVITLEFPHLLRLIQDCQFDTIYHEHFSYFSFITINRIFSAHGLKIFDVEQLSSHGGSLRIFVCHQEDKSKEVSPNVKDLLTFEKEFGMQRVETYLNFQNRINKKKRELLSLLIQIKNEEKTIIGFGAPAKGNTFLNYCGVGSDFLEYIVDETPYKQGLFLPGTHIPIVSLEKIRETKPDYVLILPWNWKDEIITKLSYISDWGGKFILSTPEIQIL